MTEPPPKSTTPTEKTATETTSTETTARTKPWALLAGFAIAAGVALIGLWRHGGQPTAPTFVASTEPTARGGNAASAVPATRPAGPAVTPSGKAGTAAQSPASEAAEPHGGPKPPLPAAPEAATGPGEPPHFDVVRVEPGGDAVLAGKGAPNADVALMSAGKVVASVKADPAGNFVILPPPLKPGSYALTLRQTPNANAVAGTAGKDPKPSGTAAAAADAPLESRQSVAVSVPESPKEPVVVALAEPGRPTRVLSAPAVPPPAATPEPAPAPPAVGVAKAPQTRTAALPAPQTKVTPPAALAAPEPKLAFRSVELENGNGFFASGVAAPGTRVRIYLNDSYLAQVTAGPDGQWTLTIRRGLTGGHYVVRADAGEIGGKVTARVEVPFDVPLAMADAKAPPPAAPKPVSIVPPPVAPSQAASTRTVGPEPPSAPNPSEVAGLGASDAAPASSTEKPAATSVRVPRDPDTVPEAASEVPTPRPDIAAAAKAASAAAPALAPPVLAVAPPASPASPAPTPVENVAKLASVAPAEPTAALPTLASAAPAVATAPPPAQQNGAVPAAMSGSANAVIEQVATALVVRGDNLWNISRSRLGQGHRFTQIYTANSAQIRDPKLIYPGQVFVMPRSE